VRRGSAQKRLLGGGTAPTNWGPLSWLCSGKSKAHRQGCLCHWWHGPTNWGPLSWLCSGKSKTHRQECLCYCRPHLTSEGDSPSVVILAASLVIPTPLAVILSVAKDLGSPVPENAEILRRPALSGTSQNDRLGRALGRALGANHQLLVVMDDRCVGLTLQRLAQK